MPGAKKAGIQYLLWVPDSETHFMHDAIQRDPELELIKVCREGETIAVCGGLHMGGAKAALLVENQGMFECGNVLKWAVEHSFPMIMLIGYLMYREMKRTPQGMTFRGMKDYTEPFLDAFNVKHYLVDSDAAVPKIRLACQEAYKRSKPVAVLLTIADGYLPGG